MMTHDELRQLIEDERGDVVEYTFGIKTPPVMAGTVMSYGGKRWKVESVRDDGDGTFTCHMTHLPDVDTDYEVVE